MSDVAALPKRRIQMAGPIYKSFHARWTEAWYQLTEEQREALFGTVSYTHLTLPTIYSV